MIDKQVDSVDIQMAQEPIKMNHWFSQKMMRFARKARGYHHWFFEILSVFMGQLEICPFKMTAILGIAFLDKKCINSN